MGDVHFSHLLKVALAATGWQAAATRITGPLQRGIIDQSSISRRRSNKVRARVRGLDLVLDDVSQRRLDDLARVVGPLRSPVAERRPEPVRDGYLAGGSRGPDQSVYPP